MNNYSLNLIETGLLFLKNAKLRKQIYDNGQDPFRCLMVYCIKQIKPGLWLPVNRDYNAIGLTKDKWTNYTSDLYRHLWIEFKDIEFELLWNNDIDNETSNNFYFFSDSTYPAYYYNSKRNQFTNLDRYEEIVKNTFLDFKFNSEKSFEDMWGYKKQLDFQNYKKHIKFLKKQDIYVHNK